MGYPTSDEEEKILSVGSRNEKVEVRKVLSARAIVNLQKLVSSVAVSEYIVKYVAALVRSTRPPDPSAPDFVRELVDWGAGPRAGINLVTAAKARAILEGRHHATTADVKKVAYPVLRHRILVSYEAEAQGKTTDHVIAQILENVPVP